MLSMPYQYAIWDIQAKSKWKLEVSCSKEDRTHPHHCAASSETEMKPRPPPHSPGGRAAVVQLLLC